MKKRIPDIIALIDKGDIKLLKYILPSEKLNLNTVGSIQELFASLESNTVDIVLTDLKVPIHPGGISEIVTKEFFSQIHNLTPNSNVIIFTGSSDKDPDKDVVKDYWKLGPYFSLNKDSSPQELILLVIEYSLKSNDNINYYSTNHEKKKALEDLMVWLFNNIDGFSVERDFQTNIVKTDIMISNKIKVLDSIFWNRKDVNIPVECKNEKECVKEGVDRLNKFKNKVQDLDKCQLGFFISTQGFSSDFLNCLTIGNKYIVPVDEYRIKELVQSKKPINLLKEYIIEVSQNRESLKNLRLQFTQSERKFENSAYVNPQESYYVPLENVRNSLGQDMKTMVDMGRYFSIFAPRQSGKTTFFKMFCEDLEEDDTYIAILLSFQELPGHTSESFYSYIQKSLYPQLINRLNTVKYAYCDKLEKFLNKHELKDNVSFGELFQKLKDIIKSKKIVIFIDEFDGIPDAELESFLNTLRELYQSHKGVKEKALYSVGLVGIRNVTQLVVGGVSPFNIAEKVRLPSFTIQNVRDLYAQYTMETNQPFSEKAISRIYEETSGQPWLVNRLGSILTIDVKHMTSEPITEEDVEKAITILLEEHNNHFENLVEKAKKYKETCIEIVFNGTKYKPDDEKQSLLETHGLITNNKGHAVVFNDIYKKRFLNMFFDEVTEAVDTTTEKYYIEGRILNMEAILSDFENYITAIGVSAFYENGKPREKTGQFLLTAWLYQFVKTENDSLRFESTSGLGRIDIMLIHNNRKFIIETKMNRGKLDTTIEDAKKQVISKYMKTERVNEGYIVIFDTKTQVGDSCPPQKLVVDKKEVMVFCIGIGGELQSQQ
ncbi:MAG: hypothetical protein GY941_07795 [Planctomycetes bacterium]|nr:hypothetical protein [Planctomycetota bacterium]